VCFPSSYSIAQPCPEVKTSPATHSTQDRPNWLTQVYESLKPPSGTGKLLWHALGAKTLDLIHLYKYQLHRDQDLFDRRP
jgi:type I restriction enzyme R subunit